MEEKIEIIEGPPPTFEAVNEDWVWSLNEGPNLTGIALTRLRTFNGPSLVERCYQAWRNQMPIFLEFRDFEGNISKTPIVAARNVEVEEGHMLLLWVRLIDEGIEIEIGYEDDWDEDDDDWDYLF